MKKSAFGFIEIIIVLVVLGIIASMTLPSFVGEKGGGMVQKAHNAEFETGRLKVSSTLGSAIVKSGAIQNKYPSDSRNNGELASIIASQLNIIKQKKSNDGWVSLYSADGIRYDIPKSAYGCSKSMSGGKFPCIIYADVNGDAPPSDSMNYDVQAYKENRITDIFPVVVSDSGVVVINDNEKAYRAFTDGEL